MNKILGKITQIENEDRLVLIHLELAQGTHFKSIVVESEAHSNKHQVATAVQVLFKETEVALGTALDLSISLQNRLSGEIVEIEKGKLLSRLVLLTREGKVTSIISTNSLHSLDFKIGDQACAYIKLNEVILE